MKQIGFLLTLMISVLSYASQGYVSILDLKEHFSNPREYVQTSVYWYWINDNITEEGALNDLEAMKDAGINRAFIGFIGLSERGPQMGNCNMFSNEWWHVIHSVFKRAAELGIEIGVFNSPGWSQSGGPWVSAKQTMRYLTSYEYSIGGGKVKFEMPKMPVEFQDIRLLAVREETYRGGQAIGHFHSDNIVPEDLRKIQDGNLENTVLIPNESTVMLVFENPVELSSFVFNIAKSRNIGRCLLSYKDVDGAFKRLDDVVINRFNFDVKVGFYPDAPIIYSFKKIETDCVKFEFSSSDSPLSITEISAYSKPLLMNYPEKSLAKMFQQTLPSWYEYQWNFLEVYGNHDHLTPDGVIDISDRVVGNMLQTELPKGNWKLLRFGMLPTQVMNHPAPINAKGLEIDKMNKSHIAFHFDNFIGEILDRIPKQDRTSFKYVVADSYETGGQNFTDDMIQSFVQAYGYNPIPYFPVFNGVVVTDRLASDRFLWDFRRLIADRIAYDYVGGLRKKCNENGLSLWLENYGHWGFPAEFLQYGGQADEVAGEFWSYGMLGNIENRAASSCGHIYGKNRISAESFTCGPDQPYSRYPALMKQRGDKFFSEGINSTLLHLYILQPDNKAPGINAWFGNEFNRNNTWFSYMDLFTDYLKRCNLMLQQGLNVADVAYFIGEDTPKMTGVREPEIPSGYQFDYMNAEVLLRDVKVVNGCFVLPHGTSYRVLVLPPQNTIRPNVLEKVYQFIKEGGTVLGNVPALLSPSNENQPEADHKVKEISNVLWTGNERVSASIGKGNFYSRYSLKEVFNDINLLADVDTDDSELLFSHRKADNLDIYFITNQSDTYKNIDIKFRTQKSYVEKWNPVSGENFKIETFRREGNVAVLNVSLYPYESMFYVFTDKSSANSHIESLQPIYTYNVDSDWEIRFCNPVIGVDTIVKTDELKLWNESSDDVIKYYSGTAVYSNNINLSKDKISKANSIELILEEVNVMAKVYVNDKYAGGVWTKPYSLNITDKLKSGMNKIEIHIVNTWVNKLIGDTSLPAEERRTFTSVNPWKATDELKRSGMIGRVCLMFKK